MTTLEKKSLASGSLICDNMSQPERIFFHQVYDFKEVLGCLIKNMEYYCT